ncbi:Protein of unknown function [Fervidobacterium changbaicum]|uniref:DUF721 domain-containing protein n=2 Tax=Fervidobacterium TaxID=2422 RepID=A0AAI8CLS8_FERIS|nr:MULTISPECIES: DciA family protein [Fervidobacterium]AMW32762.1 DUF721 domain-containing protein [Fervidobacterium islandicum]QAV32795.1 DUF721 domain-containing protein [Fervidobacterium changbaicum]SDG95196.1 Protein of unknown function [Fervidobacterium changbaicum]
MFTLKKAFEDLAKSNEFFRKLLVLSSLQDETVQILGSAVSKHCTFKSFESGIVTITCDDIIWSNELKKMKRQIKKKIEQYLGITFSDIKIEVERKR